MRLELSDAEKRNSRVEDRLFAGGNDDRRIIVFVFGRFFRKFYYRIGVVEFSERRKADIPEIKRECFDGRVVGRDALDMRDLARHLGDDSIGQRIDVLIDAELHRGDFLEEICADTDYIGRSGHECTSFGLVASSDSETSDAIFHCEFLR